MSVLVFDTAGPVIGVAVGDASGRVWQRVERIQRGAEGRLLVHASALLEEAGCAREGLRGIGVVDGPGGFTGLRVGLATAVGLATSLGLPLWTAGSLETRGRRVQTDGMVLSMLDARKAKVYAMRLVGGVAAQGPEDVPIDEALAWMVGPFVATGEGAAAYAREVRAVGGEVASEPCDPAVDVLARETWRAIEAGEGQDARGVRPRYFRLPDAKPSARAKPL